MKAEYEAATKAKNVAKKAIDTFWADLPEGAVLDEDQ